MFCDEKSDAFLYNPVNDVTVDIPNYPPSAIGLLWDKAQFENVHATFFDTILRVHIATRNLYMYSTCIQCIIEAYIVCLAIYFTCFTFTHIIVILCF